MRGRLVLPLLLFLAAGAAALAQSGAREPHAFLRKHLGFTAADLSAMERGEVVTRLPAVGDPREVATFGVIRVQASKEALAARFRDIVAFKKSPNVLAIGRFSQPPRVEDLRGLTMDEEDFDALRVCSVGDCGVKLPAKTINRLRREVNWTAPDARAQVDRLLRQTLVEYAGEYLRGGNAALSEYRDKAAPLRLADEFRALLRQSPYLYEYAPEFHQYLEQFPRKPLPGAEDFLYWSKEKFGFKPVLSVTHVTIYRRNLGAASSLLIASKQIYASHYFDSSLGLTAFVEDRAGAPASYLMYLNRSRADALGGNFSSMKRSLLASELRRGTEQNLRRIRQLLETGR